MFQLWRKNSWCLALTAIFLVSLVSGLRINEVMPHTNNSLGNEWVELYNEESFAISLANWNITDEISSISSTLFSLNISANSYALLVEESINCNNFILLNISCIRLTWLGSKLNDGGDVLKLYNNESILISNFSWGSDIKSSGKSWQFYNSIWQTCLPTPGLENLCQEQSCIQNWSCTSWGSCVSNQQTRTCIDSNNCGNLTGKPVENQACSSGSSNSSIYLELEYDEKVENSNEFEVNVKAFNLNGSYDIKVYLEDNGTIISEVYDVSWKSGTYYVNNFFNGTGNKSSILKLKLQDKYENFTGETEIYGKIRNNEKIIDEFFDNIKVVKEDESIIKEESNNEKLNGSLDFENSETSSNIIRLNEPKDIKSSEIWKSKTQYIKEYAIYGFALLCIIIIILLSIEKWKK